MSEVAGRLSIIEGAHHLLRASGGRGLLPGGVPGTPRAKVVVIGGGVAGEHAAANALGLGARVTVVDISLPKLRQLEERFGGAIETRASTRLEIAEQLADADLVIGSVLIPGAAAPKLVTDDMVAAMKPGSVLVDIAIDQGGCFEGSRPTTHDARRSACTKPSTTASPTCRARFRTPRPAPCRTRRCPTSCASPTTGGKPPPPRTPLAKGLNVRAGVVVNEGVRAAFDL